MSCLTMCEMRASTASHTSVFDAVSSSFNIEISYCNATIREHRLACGGIGPFGKLSKPAVSVYDGDFFLSYPVGIKLEAILKSGRYYTE